MYVNFNFSDFRIGYCAGETKFLKFLQFHLVLDDESVGKLKISCSGSLTFFLNTEHCHLYSFQNECVMRHMLNFTCLKL